MNPSPEIATSAAASTPARRPFHILTKPIGPICNLDCQYCFYLEKEKLYPGESRWRMSDEVLEKYIREYIHSQPVNEIHFAWQGGEPTLLGLDFFQKVVHLQKRHAGGKTIANAIQTNGTLINDDWASFLAGENFLVGLSIDGPRELHDRYRVDKQQQPTFDRVVRGLEHLQRRRVEYNTLTVVSRANAFEPLTVYRFLKSIGSQFLQFIPLVERRTLAGQGAEEALASPPHKEEPGAAEVTEWSVPAAQYGTFLCAIFDEWVRRDVGTVFVQLFDTALGNWLGLGSSLCVFAEKCGSALAMEHNGDVYSCDHYVYPRYHLGNILNQSLGSMLHSPAQERFGNDKSDTLPAYCRRCAVRFACHGECPKHRFMRTPDGESGLNYLCPAYKQFFHHVQPAMAAMAQLLQTGRAPAEIMGMLNPRQPLA